jgi:hypothetical protein
MTIKRPKKGGSGDRQLDTRRMERSQPIIDLSCLGDSGRKSTRAQRSNSRNCELRGVLDLRPSRWLLVEALTSRNHTHIIISGIESLQKRSLGSFTHELVSCELRKVLMPRPSCGRMGVKLAPSACSHRWGFRRTYGSDS